jgi:hypothetical protein
VVSLNKPLTIFAKNVHTDGGATSVARRKGTPIIVSCAPWLAFLNDVTDVLLHLMEDA